jgi:hypothetical protein
VWRSLLIGLSDESLYGRVEVICRHVFAELSEEISWGNGERLKFLGSELCGYGCLGGVFKEYAIGKLEEFCRKRGGFVGEAIGVCRIAKSVGYDDVAGVADILRLAQESKEPSEVDVMALRVALRAKINVDKKSVDLAATSGGEAPLARNASQEIEGQDGGRLDAVQGEGQSSSDAVSAVLGEKSLSSNDSPKQAEQPGDVLQKQTEQPSGPPVAGKASVAVAAPQGGARKDEASDKAVGVVVLPLVVADAADAAKIEEKESPKPSIGEGAKVKEQEGSEVATEGVCGVLNDRKGTDASDISLGPTVVPLVLGASVSKVIGKYGEGKLEKAGVSMLVGSSYCVELPVDKKNEAGDVGSRTKSPDVADNPSSWFVAAAAAAKAVEGREAEVAEVAAIAKEQSSVGGSLADGEELGKRAAQVI